MSDRKRAIALGFFGGVHRGHAALLERTKERAAQIGAEPSVLSFDVHPDTLVFGKEVPLINSPEDREGIIRREFGIDNVVFIHFNKEVMRMDWKDFLDSLIQELNVCWIVVGYDFCFGYKGQGTTTRLREYCDSLGIGCDVIDQVTLDGKVVSSTYIRELIQEGDMEQAARFLGHPHTLSDTIRSGYHLGTKLGTPTINMGFSPGVLVPRHGVYATRVHLDGQSYTAVTNVGVRPTVSQEDRISVESHLLDLSGNLYGKHARVDFCHFLRDEVRFASAEELSAQIRKDVENARAYFAH